MQKEMFVLILLCVFRENSGLETLWLHLIIAGLELWNACAAVFDPDTVSTLVDWQLMEQLLHLWSQSFLQIITYWKGKGGRRGTAKNARIGEGNQWTLTYIKVPAACYLLGIDWLSRCGWLKHLGLYLHIPGNVLKHRRYFIIILLTL